MITIVQGDDERYYPYHAFKLYHQGTLYIDNCKFTPTLDKGMVLKLLQFASRGLDVTIKVEKDEYV